MFALCKIDSTCYWNWTADTAGQFTQPPNTSNYQVKVEKGDYLVGLFSDNKARKKNLILENLTKNINKLKN